MFIKNERGFTFIEAMLQLFIIIVFSGAILYSMQYLMKFTHAAYNKEETEFELFVQYFESYLYDLVSVTPTYDKRAVYLEQANAIVIFEQYGYLMRKRIDNKGHEPVLMRIENVQYTYNGEEVKVYVKFLNGLEKERSFYVSK